MPNRRSATKTRNLLLDLLPPAESGPLLAIMERVSLETKKSIGRAGQPIAFAYFPVSGMISTVLTLADGNSVEMATIGCEGMVGVSLALGTDENMYDQMTQLAGESFRMPARDFVKACGQYPAFGTVIHRYVAVLLRQTGQLVACNARHPVEGRLSRWLLMTHDRARAEEFPLTQEFLAMMLGVRRQSVTETASALQQSGLITYRRGVVRVVDRSGLEKASCECYHAMRLASERLLGEAECVAS